MSDNIADDIFEKAFESTISNEMGNLQRSINRSLEIAQNSERTYLPGETKSTNHLIYEMNEFYLEMAQKIKELKLKRYDNYSDDEEDVEDTDSVLYEVVNAIRKKRNDPEIRKQIETVLKLDQMMEESYKTLKEEQTERQKVQKQLCELIEREDDEYARTRFFRDLCDFEESKLNSRSNQKECDNKTNNKHLKNQTRSEPKKDNKFIKRNIQLAKNTPTMFNSTYSLTDEEKVKLDQLLIDVDTPQDTDTDVNSDNSALFDKDDDCDQLLGLGDDSSTIYPFSLSLQDQTRMRELETELENLSEVSLVPSKQKTTVHHLLEGKQWQNEDRLKQIDEKLEKLQSERESFTFEPTEVALPSSLIQQEQESLELDEDDTANDVESISYDTLRERSQEMLQQIASIVRKTSDEYSDHENDEPERD